MDQKIIALFSIVILSFSLLGQSTFNYELSLVPVNLPELPGLHSYVFAQHNGKWLIIGGRKDGLHARQPFNSFPSSQNNTDIYMVDLAKNRVFTSSVNSLPTGLKEQLQSTNMNFYQDGDYLYITGGYGFSPTANNHITYPYLTSVHVSGLISAIENSQSINPYFKQIQDKIFKVTGGHLKKLNGLFYLVGGHLFDGRYNPMGNHTFTQEYTNQIRKFTINNSGNQLSYSNYSTVTDPVHLRRRDYNLIPQIFPNGEHGFTISSGVFQINADLPFLYPVDITEKDYTPVTQFNQYLSNYHSAAAAMHDAKSNTMHSLFFGGISQYYYKNGTLIQDNHVPFVKTISRVSRDANGNLTEYQMPVEMPGLKGSSAEFIPNLNLPHYSNKILKINDISQNSFMIGHIFGGINSPSENPFSSNQTNSTKADNTVYEVWLKANPVSFNEYEIDGSNPYKIEVFPNPFTHDFKVKFKLDKTSLVSYFLTNSQGQIMETSASKEYPNGNYELKINPSNNVSGEIFNLTVVFDDKYYVTKKLISR